LALAAASRVLAAAKGQPFVTPTEVQELVVSVFAHRLVLTLDARRNDATGESVVGDIAETVLVPDHRV
jgi:MoxR-like ATPase